MDNLRKKFRLWVLTPSISVPGQMTYIDRQLDGIKKFHTTILTLKKGDNYCANVIDIGGRNLFNRIVQKLVNRSSIFFKKPYWLNNDIFAQKNLRRQIISNNFDIILVHFVGMAVSFLPILEKVQVPIVIVCHESETANHSKIKKYKAKLEILFDVATIVLCVSNYMKNIVIEAGCPASKVRVLYLGVPIPAVQKLNYQNEKVDFISTGRLDPIKNYEMLIDSFSDAALPNAELSIIGDGPLENHLKERAKNNPNIVLTGRLPNREVYQQLQKSDVYIQTSNNESLGIAILEAMACGLPVIATDVGGVSEIVLHGKTGFLVPKKDKKSLTRFIREMSMNWKLRQEFGNIGQNLARDLFDCNVQNEKLEKLLIELVDNRSNPV
jgi:colanic acid/amylovoran biosynthesis glycosyltransferase